MSIRNWDSSIGRDTRYECTCCGGDCPANRLVCVECTNGARSEKVKNSTTNTDDDLLVSDES